MRIFLGLVVLVVLVAAVTVAALMVRSRRLRARIIRLDWPRSRSSEELAWFCTLYLQGQGWQALQDVDRVGVRGKGRSLWIICRGGGKKLGLTHLQDALHRAAKKGGNTDLFLAEEDLDGPVREMAETRSVRILRVPDLANLEERLPPRRKRKRKIADDDGMEAAMMGEPGGVQ